MNYKEYYDLIAPKYITWEFYSKYIDYNIPFGTIGDIVDCRTYRRFIPELNRRERATEAFLRTVDYNIKLVERLLPFDILKKEAELMFDSLVNLKMLPSNRSRWVGGTKSVELNPASIFNCSFTAINRLDVFADIFELLCLGVGVGYRVFYKDVGKLPTIKNKNFYLIHNEYKSLPKQAREENTSQYIKNGVLKVTIGDSREGWKNALMLMINVFFHDKDNNIKAIEFDYDSVRPFGERILGFGGTASGPDALKQILSDVFLIIKECSSDKLRTLDALDIPCAIAKGVVAGSSRRSALMVWFEENDELCANSKVNIPSNKLYRYQANITSCVGSLYYDEFVQFLITYKPTEQQVIEFINTVKPPIDYFQKRFKQMENLGEPGINNFLWLVYKRWLGVIKYRPFDNPLDYLDICTNPCFTGNMKLLTSNGYKSFEELNNTEFLVVNKNGNLTLSKVWCSGTKYTVKLRLSNKQVIECTPDHVLSTLNGEFEAQYCKNKQLTPFLKLPNNDLKYKLLGFIQGDGTLSRMNSETHKGLEISIGKKDADVLELFREAELKFNEIESCIYLNDPNIITQINDLGFDKKTLPFRELPFSYKTWTLEQKKAFLTGCYSANGSVLSTGRVTYKTTCYNFALQLQEALVELNIDSYITTNKSKPIKFNNGVYVCKESYDVNISSYSERIKFFNSINFIQQYKQKLLAKLLFEQAPYVTSIKDNGIVAVYDFVEPETHWGVVEGFIVHNCSEIIGTTGLDHISGGFCNLTTNNLLSFVKLDSTSNYYFDYEDCKKTTELITRIGLRQTEVNIPLNGWNETQRTERLLGVDTTCGFQDVCNALGWKYNSREASDLRIKLRQWANDEATRYADVLSVPQPLLVTTSKPNGTTAQVLGTASGIHWNWSKYYLRRVTITSTDPLAKTLRKQGFKCYPGLYELDKVNSSNELSTFDKLDLFDKLDEQKQNEIIENCNTIVFEFPVKTNANISANDVPAIEQLESQRLFSVENTDHTPSITITVKKHEWDEVTNWIFNNWTNGFNTAAFLSYDEQTYALLPFQTITKEEYDYHFNVVKNNAVINDNKTVTFKLNVDLLDHYEALLQAQKDENDLIIEACEIGGSCPSR